MSSALTRRLVAAGATAALAASPLLVPATASAAALPCKASMSIAKPEQYSTTVVRVKTAKKATVKTVAHYRTTKTTKWRKANNAGRANASYYIASARPGYKVRVTVTVKKSGKTRTCSTSFTPKR